jgi:hypothetical protein
MVVELGTVLGTVGTPGVVVGVVVVVEPVGG